MKLLSTLIAMTLVSSSTALAEDQKQSSSHHQMHQKMQSMMKDMETMQPRNNTDQDFTQMMIRHHQSGIDMAKIQLDSGKDPEIRKMAEKMIKEQQKDIAKLKKWQEKNAG